MIEYISSENVLKYVTKDISQSTGVIDECVVVDNYNINCHYYFELKCPKDNRYVSEEILFNGKTGRVRFSNCISNEIGKIKVQLVIRNEDNSINIKSLLSNQPLYNVIPSINATMNIDSSNTKDYIAGVQENLTNNENRIQNVQEEISLFRNITEKKYIDIESKLNEKPNQNDLAKLKKSINQNTNDINNVCKSINKKSQIDLLWQGRLSSGCFEINNHKEYDILIILAYSSGTDSIICGKYNHMGNIIIASEPINNLLDFGQIQFIMKVNNNCFTLEEIGFWKFINGNMVYNDRKGLYYVYKVYGIKAGA